MTGLEVFNTGSMTPLITDKDLPHIKRMTNLKKLIIASQVGKNEGLTDKVFPVIQELKQLEYLALCSCNLTDAGVLQLNGHPSLRTVDFWKSPVGDAGLMALTTLPKLENVKVPSTQVTDAGVKAFHAKAPKVQVTK